MPSNIDVRILNVPRSTRLLTLSSDCRNLFVSCKVQSYFQTIISVHFSHYYILLSSQAITAVSGMASNGWFTGMIDIAIPYEMNEVCVTSIELYLIHIF